MHIPDAYLSPATEAAATVVMIPLWAIAARKTSHGLSAKQAPLLSIGAAFCFAIQMFNIPAVGGTTAHALGATLLAILVGPWAALMGMTLSLAIQALLFGDGGILSLGANCWDMGFVASFVGYGIYRVISGGSKLGSARRIVAAGIGGYVGTVTASLSAGILLGIQPLVAHDAAGHALYCPFGLNVAVPAMVMSHLLIAGPAEAIITVAAVAYLWRAFPEFAIVNARPPIGAGVRMLRKFGWVLILTPIGLLAGGDAWGEWDLSTLKKMVGYAPEGIAKSRELVHPLLPDYGFEGFTSKPWLFAGYLVSALVGCGLVAAFTRGILRSATVDAVEDVHPGKPEAALPDWLGQPNSTEPQRTGGRSKWLENTIFKLQATLEKTIAAEIVAHSPGFLQSVHPLAKAIGFIGAIVAVGLARSPWLLFGLIGISLGAAGASNVDLKSLVRRVAEAVAFFGIVVAAPVSLRAVTSGPVAFSVLGLEASSTGLQSAGMILLRLAAGISLAIVWNLTTKWYELLRSLRSLGVPALFLTTATLTYRYLFVVIETMSEMVQARSARDVGGMDKRQGRTYAGSGAAILFAKSQAFTEEVHHAMQARSLGAVSKAPYARAWRLADSVSVIVGLGSLVVAVAEGVSRVV